jgi:hypothetical protein
MDPAKFTPRGVRGVLPVNSFKLFEYIVLPKYKIYDWTTRSVDVYRFLGK